MFIPEAHQKKVAAGIGRAADQDAQAAWGGHWAIVEFDWMVR